MKLIKPTILFTILFSLFFTNISHAEVSEKNYLVSKTDAEKKYELGMMYSNGLGSEKDDKKAFEWINKAAEQNNADAQYFLGSMYQSGEGVAKNKRKALEWFNKSAQQGNEKAIEELKNY